MTIKIEVRLPVVGKKIEVDVWDTEGYEFMGQDHDRDEQRFVLAFYRESPGAKDEPRTLTYDITHIDQGEWQTLSAGVVAGGQVIATDRDRKLIRVGSGKP